MTKDASPHPLADSVPPLPRRVFLASALSAIAAGGAVGLGALGLLTQPETARFNFLRGTSLASGEEARLRAFLANATQDDRVSVTIIGHSGTQGDDAANLALSDTRATFAADVAASLGIPADRIEAFGVGGGAPLPKAEGVSERAFQSTLARVEVSLQVRR